MCKCDNDLFLDTYLVKLVVLYLKPIENSLEIHDFVPTKVQNGRLIFSIQNNKMQQNNNYNFPDFINCLHVYSIKFPNRKDVKHRKHRTALNVHFSRNFEVLYAARNMYKLRSMRCLEI